MPAARAVDVVRALLQDYRFAGVAAVASLLDLPDDRRDQLVKLAEAGERLLDLDAEDFDVLAASNGVLPAQVGQKVRAAQFPRRPDGAERGSLASLVPLYELMLEALDVRWRRREPIHVVTLLHLIGEYFPLLAWERTLGHAADPRQLREFVEIEGSLWGVRVRECDHTASQCAAAQRVGHATRGDVTGWTVYLDRFHSRVSDALAKCASHSVAGRPALEGICRTPCTVWTQLSESVRLELGARVHLARMYADSPVVALRHYAPVGHFFGVPSPREITEAWQRSRHRLTRDWPSGDNPLLAWSSPEAGEEALSGLTAVVSAVAGRPIRSGRVLTGIRDTLVSEFGGEPL